MNRAARIAIIFLLTVCAWPKPILGNPVALGHEFQINTHTTESQNSVSVAGGAHGSFVAVWRSQGQDGEDGGIFGQLYDAEGQKQGDEFQVGSLTTGSQSSPAVATDAAGDFVVAWSAVFQEGDVRGIFARRYDSAGQAQGEEFQVNTTTTGRPTWAQVSSDPLGNFVVVWFTADSGQSGDGRDVFGQRFYSDGLPMAGEFRVNSTTASAQNYPSVAHADSGDFVVTWMSYEQDGDHYGIIGQRFDSSGAASGTEFQINSSTTGRQQVPSVSFDSTGRFAVVWESDHSEDTMAGILGQRFDSQGNAIGSEFEVSVPSTKRQRIPHMAMAPNGEFAVVWTLRDVVGDSVDNVYGRFFDSLGQAIGDPFQVNTFTTNQQSRPAVAMLPENDFVVAWSSDVLDGSLSNVAGQRFSSTILFQDGFEAGHLEAWSLIVGD